MRTRWRRRSPAPVRQFDQERQASGKKGGKARAEALTPEQRREKAKKAAAARWED